MNNVKLATTIGLACLLILASSDAFAKKERTNGRGASGVPVHFRSA